MRKHLKNIKPYPQLPEEDPMSGISNLFDLSIVFIVALIIALFSVYRLQEMFDTGSEFTMVKTDKQGRKEIIIKDGKKIETLKVTTQSMTGKGDRLGIAYRLKDGSVIYVPDDSS